MDREMPWLIIERLFSSSLLSAIRVVSSAYLRLLIFLLAILIPACASSSPAFLMMYFACKLNKQGDNIQPWCTPFWIWNQSVVPCSVLAVASLPAYRFLRRQVTWSGHCWVFQICWHIECSTFTEWSFRIWNSLTGIPLIIDYPTVFLSVLFPFYWKNRDTER